MAARASTASSAARRARTGTIRRSDLAPAPNPTMNATDHHGAARRPLLRHAPLFIATLAATLPACRSPLAIPADEALGQRIDAIARQAGSRQIDPLPADSIRTVGAQESEVERVLAARREELDAIGPQSRALGATVSGVVPLTAEPAPRVLLTLGDAVAAAVANNLDAETARLARAIRDEELAQAVAAFDWVLGAGVGVERLDQPSIGILFPGAGSTPVIPNVTLQKNVDYSASLAKPLTSGGSVSLSVGSKRIDNLQANLFTPDPAWTTAVTLGVTQPLLRGFGEDVSLAEVRLAANNGRIAAEDVRARLLDVVAQVEQAYWNLVSARARLVSAEWLVSAGEEVRDILAKRREFDATLAEYANAVATVEARKALVIQARRALSEAGNQLKALLNDPALPIGGEADVVPADLPSVAAFEADLRGSIETALANAPAVAQALVAVESADIGVVVADNGLLPQLDLEASVAWFGLDKSWSESYAQVGEGDFVNSLAALRFSQALGNRFAEAAYARARLQRSQAVVQYDRAVQGTVLAVKNALVDCVAFRELVEQNRVFRLAQAENLRALLVDEKTLAALTPEFLQLKFQLQNGLAQAEDQFFASVVGYQGALARLRQAMGTGLEARGIEVVEPAASGSDAWRGELQWPGH
jgi:outer membrane protein